MRFPKMILFDYGHTLCCEPGFDLLNAERELFRYVKDNPNNVTPEEACAFATELFKELDKARRDGFEVHEYPALRYKNEYLGLSYTVSLEEAEQIFWDATSEGAMMPGADVMLRYLRENGIRSAVISNIGFSGKALSSRINRLLPENNLEFIIASSEYCFRKPSPRLFELALKKAGLEAKDVWYCGDNPVADVEGSAGAGLFPVWYDNDFEKLSPSGKNPSAPTVEHLHITDWKELLAVLDDLKTKQE